MLRRKRCGIVDQIKSPVTHGIARHLDAVGVVDSIQNSRFPVSTDADTTTCAALAWTEGNKPKSGCVGEPRRDPQQRLSKEVFTFRVVAAQNWKVQPAFCSGCGKALSRSGWLLVTLRRDEPDTLTFLQPERLSGETG
jgi:hypothetical protein